jgi:hypothetical protein
MNVSYLAGHEQHNLEVFTELLGLTDSEITELMEKKVIYEIRRGWVMVFHSKPGSRNQDGSKT